MTAFWKKYFALRQRNARIAWDRAKHMKFCYAFLAPYALLFLTFYILPMLISIYYSFTYNNILEPARFIGMDNYITLILKDDVFLTAVKNTFLLAVITGPVGYIMSFCFAWLINELPRWVRTIAVVILRAVHCGQCLLHLLYHLPRRRVRLPERHADEVGHPQRPDSLVDDAGLHHAGHHHRHAVDEHVHGFPFLRRRLAGR